jgi:predicted NBD/HSP70 family sugar kinase
MSAAAMKYLLVRPKVPAPLDPNFCPVVLAKKQYLKLVGGSPFTLEWALPRADGCGRGSLPVLADGHADVDASVHLAGVLIQSMIWQRSASELLLCGPKMICEAIQKAFSPEGKYAFEVRTMPKVCGTPGRPFPVKIISSASELPAAKDTKQVCGKDASGCRLAFDLGKSDIKTVAVKDNEVIDSKETEWDVTNPDPQYHWDMILKAMKDTAAGLPRVDAIGGSATGTVSGDSEATWCDCFPNVSPDEYQAKVVNIFKRLAKEFGDVPLKVINDGEVTALAGKLMVKQGNLMGISMGSSEGGGYCDADGNLMGWINEMAYIPLDLNPDAPYDPWSPHSGQSSMYLGQRAATRLASLGCVDLPDELKPESPEMNTMKHEGHAKCLKFIQAAMKDPAKEPQVRLIYETIGVYLGYVLAQYSDDYPIENVLILGRVSTGTGGNIMLDKAKEVLMAEFPNLAHIKFHQPDEHFKRVGQCIAAAALPNI